MGFTHRWYIAPFQGLTEDHPNPSNGGAFFVGFSLGTWGFAWAAWRGEACEAPSEAKPVMWRPRRGHALILLIFNDILL